MPQNAARAGSTSPNRYSTTVILGGSGARSVVGVATREDEDPGKRAVKMRLCATHRRVGCGCRFPRTVKTRHRALRERQRKKTRACKSLHANARYARALMRQLETPCGRIPPRFSPSLIYLFRTPACKETRVHTLAAFRAKSKVTNLRDFSFI